jgi:hypothetical protein
MIAPGDCFFCCWLRNLLLLVFCGVVMVAAVSAVGMVPVFVVFWLVKFLAIGAGPGGWLGLLAALIVGAVAGGFIWWLESEPPSAEEFSLADWFRTCRRGGWHWRNRQQPQPTPRPVSQIGSVR